MRLCINDAQMTHLEDAVKKLQHSIERLVIRPVGSSRLISWTRFGVE